MSRRRPLANLDPALKEVLDRLLTEGRFTIREITTHLNKLGASISRSAVGRYSQHFERVAADIRATREMALAIGRELEAVPDGDSGRMVIESLQALLLRARIELGQNDEVDPSDLARLTRSAKDLQQALRTNIESEIRVRDRALKDAAAAVEEVATQEGLTAATVEAIRARILGIKEPHASGQATT